MNPTAYSQNDGPSNWGFYWPSSPEMSAFVDPTHVESYGLRLKSPEMDQHLRSVFPELSNAQDRRREWNIQYGYAQKATSDELDFSEFFNFDIDDDVMIESFANSSPEFDSSYYSTPASFGTPATTMGKSPRGDSGTSSSSQPSPASANSPYGLERQASTQSQQQSQQENIVGARTMVFTTDMEVAATRTRAKYTPEKRKEVAEVRKRGACQECKKRKKKCKHVGISQVTATPIRRPRDPASTLPSQRIAAQINDHIQAIHTLSHHVTCNSSPGHSESAQATSPGDFRLDSDFILYPESPEDPMDRWLAYNDPTWPISQPQMEAGIFSGTTYAGSPFWSTQQVQSGLRNSQGMVIPNESAATLLPEQSTMERPHADMQRFTDGDIPYQYQGGQLDDLLVRELNALRDSFAQEPNDVLPRSPSYRSDQGLQGDREPRVTVHEQSDATFGTYRRGPWSQVEDALLLQLVQEQGPNNWVRIANSIRTRTPKQCRERYHLSLAKPQTISRDEGLMIESLVVELGKNWAEIALRLPGLSENAIKNWWNGGMNRRLRCRRPADSEASLQNSLEHSRANSAEPSRDASGEPSRPPIMFACHSLGGFAAEAFCTLSTTHPSSRPSQNPPLPLQPLHPIQRSTESMDQDGYLDNVHCADCRHPRCIDCHHPRCDLRSWTCCQCADDSRSHSSRLKQHIVSRHTLGTGSTLSAGSAASRATTVRHYAMQLLLALGSPLLPIQQMATERHVEQHVAESTILFRADDSTGSSVYPRHRLQTGQEDYPRNTFFWVVLYPLLSQIITILRLGPQAKAMVDTPPFSRKQNNPLLYFFAGYLIWTVVQDPWAWARLVLYLLVLMFLRSPNFGYQ